MATNQIENPSGANKTFEQLFGKTTPTGSPERRTPLQQSPVRSALPRAYSQAVSPQTCTALGAHHSIVVFQASEEHRAIGPLRSLALKVLLEKQNDDVDDKDRIKFIMSDPRLDDVFMKSVDADCVRSIRKANCFIAKGVDSFTLTYMIIPGLHHIFKHRDNMPINYKCVAFSFVRQCTFYQSQLYHKSSICDKTLLDKAICVYPYAFSNRASELVRQDARFVSLCCYHIILCEELFVQVLDYGRALVDPATNVVDRIVDNLWRLLRGGPRPSAPVLSSVVIDERLVKFNSYLSRANKMISEGFDACKECIDYDTWTMHGYFSFYNAATREGEYSTALYEEYSDVKSVVATRVQTGQSDDDGFMLTTLVWIPVSLRVWECPICKLHPVQCMHFIDVYYRLDKLGLALNVEAYPVIVDNTLSDPHAVMFNVAVDQASPEELPGLEEPTLPGGLPGGVETIRSWYRFAQRSAAEIRDKNLSEVVGAISVGALRSGATQAKDGVVHGFKTLFESLKDLWETCKENWKVVLALLMSIAYVVAKYYGYVKLSKFAGFGCLVLSFMGLSEYVETIVSDALDSFGDVDQELLAATDQAPIEGASFIVSVLKKFGIVIASKAVSDALFNPDKFKKTTEGYQWIWTSIKDLFMVSSMRISKWTGFDPSIFMDGEDGFVKWINRVNELTVSSEQGTLPIDRHTHSLLSEVYEDGIKLAADLKRNKNFAQSSELNSHLRDMTKLIREMSKKLSYGGGKRVEPVGVYLVGDPGTGKSNLAALISHFCVVWYLTKVAKDPKQLEEFEENPNRFIYHKNAEKWWPGIRDFHLVIEHDDFLQLRGAVGSEVSDGLSCIQVVNSAPWCPPMAEANEKGAVHPTPMLYLCTGNVWKISDEAIEDKEAVARRLIPIRVSNKGVKACDLNSDFDASIYNLEMGVWNGANTDFSTARNISIRDLGALIISRYEKNMHFFNNSKVSYTGVVDDMMSFTDISYKQDFVQETKFCDDVLDQVVQVFEQQLKLRGVNQAGSESGAEDEVIPDPVGTFVVDTIIQDNDSAAGDIEGDRDQLPNTRMSRMRELARSNHLNYDLLLLRHFEEMMIDFTKSDEIDYKGKMPSRVYESSVRIVRQRVIGTPFELNDDINCDNVFVDRLTEWMFRTENQRIREPLFPMVYDDTGPNNMPDETDRLELFWRSHPRYARVLKSLGLLPSSERAFRDLILEQAAIHRKRVRRIDTPTHNWRQEVMGIGLFMKVVYVAYASWHGKCSNLGKRIVLGTSWATPWGPSEIDCFFEYGISLIEVRGWRLPIPTFDVGVALHTAAQNTVMSTSSMLQFFFLGLNGFKPDMGTLNTIMERDWPQYADYAHMESQRLAEWFTQAREFYRTVRMRSVGVNFKGLLGLGRSFVNRCYEVVNKFMQWIRHYPAMFMFMATAAYLVLGAFFGSSLFKSPVGDAHLVSKAASAVSSRAMVFKTWIIKKLGSDNQSQIDCDVTFVRHEEHDYIVVATEDDDEFYMIVGVNDQSDGSITTEDNKCYRVRKVDDQSGKLSIGRSHGYKARPKKIVINNAASAATEQVMPIIRGNTWNFGVAYSTDEVNPHKLGYAFALYGTVFIAPSHFIAGFVRRQKMRPVWIYLEKDGTKLYIPFGALTVIKDFSEEQRDLCIFKIEANIPRNKNVLQHIITRKFTSSWSMNFREKFKGCLIGPPGGSNEIVSGVRYTTDLSVNGNEDLPARTVTKLAVYNLVTVGGDCGRVLVTDDGTTGGRIFGIHTQGSTSTFMPQGYASYFDQDDVIEALASSGEPGPQGQLFSVETAGSDMCTVENYRRVVEDQIAKFSRTLPYNADVHNMETLELNVVPKSTVMVKVDVIPFETGKEPFVERKTAVSKVAPKFYGPARAKYGPQENVVDVDLIRTVAQQYCSDISDISSNYVHRVLTFEEAIRGIEGTGFRSLSLTTSAGWPYADLGLKKEDFWSILPEGTLVKNHKYFDLKNDVEQLLHDWSRGTTSIVMFKDTLKMERRAIAKVEAGKTRMISCAPVHFTIACRMLFGTSMRMFQETGVLCGTALGLNTYSDWDSLYRHLDVFGINKNCGAGDYSGFDTSHTPDLIMYAGKVLIWLMNLSPTEQNMQEIALSVIARSMHIRGSVVEQWNSSMPSGNPLTSIINCIINHMRFRLCWLDLHKMNLSCLPSFVHNVSLIVLGDDNIFTVSREYRDCFTEGFLAASQARFGATYTREDKLSVGNELRDITECTLLKRGFRYSDDLHVWLGPADLQVILETPLWTRKKEPLKIACDNASFAVRELSLHSKEVFDHWLPKIVEYFDGNWFPRTTDYFVEQASTMQLEFELL